MLSSFFEFEIRFDIGSLIIFISGIVFGFIISCLLYVYFVLRTLKNKKNIVESEVANEIKEEDIKLIIKTYQDKYVEQRKSKDKEQASNAMKDAVFGTIYDIAKSFFPESKKPLFEITIDEAIMLTNYISNRVDNLLGYRGLRIIRKLKISKIVNIVETTKKINENQVVKGVKKYKVKEVVKTGISALNIVNPFYWIKKGITSFSTRVILKKIVLIIISIAGEETYKIYSKQAFKEQDPSYIKMMNEIQEALIESDSLDDIDSEELNDYVDSLSNEEKELVLSIDNKKKKKFWKKINKDKVSSK